MVDPPTGLTLSHQSVTFGIGASGSGILVSWTPSDDGFVVSTSIQYQVAGASTWISAGAVPQQNSQSGIAPLGSELIRSRLRPFDQTGRPVHW
jgi:hypothetical protein